MKELRLTGVMYPPPEEFDRGHRRTLKHECEEFVSSELDTLVNEMIGLPLLVEHCDTELVGTVECARKTKTGAVEIEAVIKASSAKGRVAIQDILDKKLVGLSLSHAYKLSLPVQTDQPPGIKLNLVDGQDWAALANPDSGHTVQKWLREVSVTADPARIGCDISSIVCASARKQNLNNINIASLKDTGSTVDTRIVGVFSCSKMEPESVVTTDQPKSAVAGHEDTPSADQADATQSMVATEPLEVPLDVGQPPATDPPAVDPPATEQAIPEVLQSDAVN